MNPKIYFIAQAIICLTFGLGLTFVPDLLGKLYLTDPNWINEGAKFIAICFGTLLISNAIANWSTRNAEMSIGRRAFLISGFLSNVFLAIVTTNAILTNIETSAAWGTVIQTIIFGIWSGLLLMKEKVSES